MQQLPYAAFRLYKAIAYSTGITWVFSLEERSHPSMKTAASTAYIYIGYDRHFRHTGHLGRVPSNWAIDGKAAQEC